MGGRVGRQRSARTRSRGERQSSSGAVEEIAAALLSGVAAQAMVGQIAPLLFPALPPALLRLPGGAGGTLAGDVAEESAKLVVTDVEKVEVSDGGLDRNTGIVRAAQLDNVLYRAMYGLAAARRIGESVLGSPVDSSFATGGSAGFATALDKALAVERRHLEAHKSTSRRRLAAAKAVEGMVELHGPLLSWNWGETRTPREPRPIHLAADGANWRPLNGPPRSTGAYPGALNACSCAAGPPKRGARLLR